VIGRTSAVDVVEIPQQPGVSVLGQLRHPPLPIGGLKVILSSTPDLMGLMDKEHLPPFP
jgi:hypothetical protein